MSEDESKPGNNEEAVRALLRDHVQQFGELLLTPECRLTIAEIIRQLWALLGFLHREASLSQRSPEWESVVEALMREAEEGQLGPLVNVSSEDLTTIETVLNAVLAGFTGQPAVEHLDARAFIDLQRKILVEPKKRGPKPHPDYDAAFKRNKDGEAISSIARDLEPEAYETDTEGTIQRYSRALARRRELSDDSNST